MDTNNNKKVVGMGNLEIGGSYGLQNLIIAYLLDIPIFDITCLPRAFPRFYMTLPSIKVDKCVPIVVIDSFGNEVYILLKLIFSILSTKMVFSHSTIRSIIAKSMKILL